MLSAHPGKMQAVRGGVGEERKNISLNEDLQTVVGARHARRDRVGPLVKGLNRVRAVHVMFNTKTELGKWLESESVSCSRGLLVDQFRYD